MIKDFDFTPLAELVITVVSALVTLYIIPFLKEKLTVEKYEKLKTLVGVGVKAAEQIYGSKTGQQKKEYVISFCVRRELILILTRLKL